VVDVLYTVTGNRQNVYPVTNAV